MNLGVDVSFPLVLDFISCSFVSVVLYISSCVIVFSGFYISHEVFMKRFIYLVVSFVFSMLLLILFPRILGIIVGWDGLGVISFLLVVYYSDNNSLSSGIITALSNRIGDAIFVLRIVVVSCGIAYGRFDFSVLKFGLSQSFVVVLRVMVIFARITKSAVVPFSAWLPAAIAAPTPVSRLVHSSTLVTAGVYVLVRFEELLYPLCDFFLGVFSVITIILAGTGALVMVDIKKVVALSTLSQVRIIMFAISVGAVRVAFFHLLIHAFFKALMFMCLGSVIMFSGGVQDGRFLGGLWLHLPFVYVLFVVSNLALMGLPFLSGYYSKELIVGIFMRGYCSYLRFFVFFVSIVLSIFYSSRILWLVCRNQNVVCVGIYINNNFYLNLSLFFIGLGGVCMGLIGQNFIIKINVFSHFNILFYYIGVLVFLLWILNVLLVLFVFNRKIFKVVLSEFFGHMWFLKPLSGSLCRSYFLKWFCFIMNYIDIR